MSPGEDRRLEAAAREIADAGAARARAAGLRAEPETRLGIGVGRTADALFEVAEQHDADLVVVGRRGMRLVKFAVLGSVSDAAVRDGRRPVLVVPVCATDGYRRGEAEATYRLITALEHARGAARTARPTRRSAGDGPDAPVGALRPADRSTRASLDTGARGVLVELLLDSYRLRDRELARPTRDD